MPRSRRYRGTPVPPLHLVLIYVTGTLTVLCGVAYFFAPPGKDVAFLGMMLTLIGFLTGKFSNGFGKPMIPPQLDTDGDGEIDTPDPAPARRAKPAEAP